MNLGASLVLVFAFPFLPFRFGRDFMEALKSPTLLTWWICHSCASVRPLDLAPSSGLEASLRASEMDTREEEEAVLPGVPRDLWVGVEGLADGAAAAVNMESPDSKSCFGSAEAEGRLQRDEFKS